MSKTKSEIKTMKFIDVTKLIKTPDIVFTAAYEVKPYGVYMMENGDRILFDRGYSPIMRWNHETDEITCIKNSYWVDYEKQLWFYDDGLSIQKTKKLRRMITALWVGGIPVLPDDMEEIKKQVKEYKNQYQHPQPENV